LHEVSIADPALPVVTRAVSTPNTFDDVKIAGNVACLGSDDLKDDRGSLDAFLILPAHCSATAAVNLPGTTPVIMLRLAQNQPNPFDPAGGTTNISFTLPGATRASLQMFDVTGRRVRILVDQLLAAGEHGASWDGRNDDGEPVASGVYFYRLKAGGFSETRTLVKIR
jgi:hypothetical protein